MCISKRWLACLMALALLVGVPAVALAQPVAASDAGTGVFAADVLHSITAEEITGNGLAFLFTLNVQGAQKDAAHYYVADSATVTLEGVTYRVASMGAVVTNDTAVAKNPDQLVRENVRDDRTLVDVEAKRLCRVGATACAFAVRIINLPDESLASAVACRPYCVLESADGTQQTVYGDVNVSTYRLEFHRMNHTVTLPAIGADIDMVKKKDRIHVSAAQAVYALDTDFAEILTVSLTFKNDTSDWITQETDWVEYTCYDADGAVVQAATKIYIGCIDTKRHPVKTFSFDVPVATAAVRLTGSDITYWTEWS